MKMERNYLRKRAGIRWIHRSVLDVVGKVIPLELAMLILMRTASHYQKVPRQRTGNSPIELLIKKQPQAFDRFE
jgi:hypothetical protein